MDTLDQDTQVVTLPDEGLVKITHVIYGLHALSVVVALVGATTIVGSFLFSVPSLLAVILNYVKRAEVRGTWLDSHFSWQIRTFWFTLLWAVVGLLVFMTIIGIPLALAIWGITGLWVVYRVVRGWWALAENRALPQ